MNNLLSEKVIPFEGTSTFPIGKNLNEVRAFLKAASIPFNQSIDPNKGCSPEIPWTYIELMDSITLCFAQDVLFQIVFENNYEGELINGIRLGMNLSDAIRIDPSIEYNDDEEDYISAQGFWLQKDLDTNTVNSITVYVKEADTPDIFFKYEWVENYK